MRTPRGCRHALLFSLFAVAGCGGGVGHVGSQGGDGGPGSTGDDVGISPDDGGGGVDPGCASGSPIGTGQPCAAADLMCPLGTLTDCDGTVRTLECLCDGRVWTCDPVTPRACPPPAACPDPSTLLPGSACAVPEGQSCVSTDVPVPHCENGPFSTGKAECQCIGGAWSCPVSPIPCPPPPPTSCPDPSYVYSGQSCSASGTCSGNPTYCGGALFYDALQCVSGVWVTVAATACDIGDGGPFEDGGPFDVMPIFEND